MSTRPFRFGVVATPRGDGASWLATARRVSDLGFTTLLMPDGPRFLAPLPSLALVAGATGLRVGTFVLAAPLRPARSAAWEAHSMTVLTDGRFELGLGTGLPTTRPVAESFGLPYGSPAERLVQVELTIDRLRELNGADGGERHTPVLVAAGGPRSRALAARKADIATLATPPLTSRSELAAMAAVLWELAGARADDVELGTNLLADGAEIRPESLRYVGVDLGTLVALDSLTILPGSPRQMADELLRRRDQLGASYITINDGFAEALAPVIALLDGA